VRIEFDTEKDAINQTKHGVSLIFGARVFDDVDHVIVPSMCPIDGEDRYKAIGPVDGKPWTTVHVWRGSTVRMISVRRSNASEQRAYHRNPG